MATYTSQVVQLYEVGDKSALSTAGDWPSTAFKVVKCSDGRDYLVQTLAFNDMPSAKSTSDEHRIECVSVSNTKI